MMNKPHGILIFGANGSGKSTLGRELAGALDFKPMDIEDYYFEESEVPYAISRTKEEVIRLLLADMEANKSFVLSAVTGNFGEEIISKFHLAIHITAPLETRIQRVKERAIKRFGERVLKGGDMYENNENFINFVANRKTEHIDDFAQGLPCPLLTLDGARPIAELIAEIKGAVKYL